MTFFDLPSITFKPAALLSGTPGPWAGHLPFAYDLAAKVKPQLLVELGVFYGDSYFAFCQSIADNKIPCACYGIDTWRGDDHGGHYESAVYEAVARYNELTYPFFSYLLRSTFEESLARFSDESIDVLHVDGLHTYDAVRHDFESWFPKVRPGGIILFHDVAVRSLDFGVWKFWEELASEHRTFTFHHSNGLGVLLKDGGSDEGESFTAHLFGGLRQTEEAIRRYYVSCANRLQIDFQTRTVTSADAEHSIFQVFYSQNGTFSAEDSWTQLVVAGSWQRVKKQLPSAAGTLALRIDPTNRAAVVSIREIFLRDAKGLILWKWTADKCDEVQVGGTATRLPSGDELRLFSWGPDPQILLPKVPVEDTVELELEFEIDLAFTALRTLAERALDFELMQELRTSKLAAEAEALQELHRSREQTMENLHRCREQTLEKQIEALRQTALQTITDRERVFANVAVERHRAEALEREVQDLTSMDELLKRELVKLNGELTEQKANQRQFERSRSWKITAPMRRAAQLLRRG